MELIMILFGKTNPYIYSGLALVIIGIVLLLYGYFSVQNIETKPQIAYWLMVVVICASAIGWSHNAISEKELPETIEKHVRSQELERFKSAIKNNSSLEGFFPQANLFELSDNDYEEIVILLIANKSEDWNNSYGVKVVKLLYKKFYARSSKDGRLDAIIIDTYHSPFANWDFDQNIEKMLLSRSFENYKKMKDDVTSKRFLSVFILTGASQSYKYISVKYPDPTSKNALQEVLNRDVKIHTSAVGGKVRWLDIKPDLAF
jgi:hypothetical protein